MKIAVVCPYALDAVGGVQAQAIQLTEQLRAEGHEAWLVGPGGDKTVGKRNLGSTVRIRVNRSVAPIALNPRSGRRALHAIAGADVVHIHEPFAPFVSLGVLVEGSPPKVGTFHAAPGWGISAFYKTAAPLLSRIANRLSVATAVSPVAASAVASVVEKLRIIPIGLDVNAYPLSLPRHPHRVVFLGRDEPRKGFSVLLSAWTEVRKNLPTAELVVLGLTRSEPTEGVRYLGHVEERIKREELAQASVLCAPNLGHESFGTVLLEGMAAGCAVVASALPAFERVLENAAVLLPPGDSRALAASLLNLFCDTELREKLAQRGQEKVRQYTWDRILPQYLNAYREAIASGS